MPEAKRILLVGPDDLLRRSLADQLAGQGFVVSEAKSAAAARLWLGGQAADLVLLDSGIADMTLAETCGALRGDGVRGPVLALGGGDAAPLLAAGATECVVKPFRLSFLTARLQAHLRDQPRDQALRVGGFDFHPLSRLMVDGDGARIPLTEKESAILAYLHRAGERVVPRDELLGEVWGYAGAVSTHTVETYIYRLRRKFGPQPVLLTEPGGYRLAV